MREFQIVITDPKGFHARPAGQLARQAAEYESTVEIANAKGSADVRRLMAMLRLQVKHGETLTVRVTGPDEQQAAAGLQTFLQGIL